MMGTYQWPLVGADENVLWGPMGSSFVLLTADLAGMLRSDISSIRSTIAGMP